MESIFKKSYRTTTTEYYPNLASKLSAAPTFSKHKKTPHLYHNDKECLTVFPLNRRPKTKLKATYKYVPYICELTFLPTEFCPVDVIQHKLDLSIVGHFSIPHILDSITCPPETLQEAFEWLPHAVRQICGSVHFPSNNGASILQSIQQLPHPVLYGTSDASLKSQRSTHAWIISSGQIDDIMDPERNISGAGPVNGLSPYLSSSRAELTGLLPIYSWTFIIKKPLL